MEIRLPFAEVVVDVDNRNSSAFGALFEGSDPGRHGQREVQELVSSGKFQVVNDIDEEQRHSCGIWGVAV